MNQEYPTTPPAPPSPSKKWTWKETLTLLSLVFLPIIGLILMWTIANWSNKTKIIITVVLFVPVILIGILSLITLVSIDEARKTARDAVRKADMQRIVAAQEEYYNENGVYYTSLIYPSGIGSYMVETPTDPKTKDPYGWIDNRDNNQKFCAYADLEKDGFYVATHKGNGEIATEPRTISDCEKFKVLPLP